MKGRFIAAAAALAVLSGFAGATQVREATAADTFYVIIDGPSTVQVNDECGFYAEVGGGTAPYTYSWSINGGTGYVLQGEPYTYVASTSGTQYTLAVTVTDANNQQAFGQALVRTSSMAGPCYM